MQLLCPGQTLAVLFGAAVPSGARGLAGLGPPLPTLLPGQPRPPVVGLGLWLSNVLGQPPGTWRGDVDQGGDAPAAPWGHRSGTAPKGGRDLVGFRKHCLGPWCCTSPRVSWGPAPCSQHRAACCPAGSQGRRDTLPAGTGVVELWLLSGPVHQA